MTVKFGADISYFLWSVGTGFIFALLYDFVRAIRGVVRASDLIVNLTDVLILIICGFVILAEAYFINSGELRVYSILCILMVFLLYRLIMGNRLSAYISRLIIKTAKAVAFPIRGVLSFLKKFMKKLHCIKEKVNCKININNKE